MLKRSVFAAVMAVSLCGAASAAPADEAKTHFNAIGRGQVDAIMQGYAAGAVLEWVGGPLDGKYQGAEQIRGVWTKFAKAQGPLSVSVGTIQESANPKGATVTANVEFKGKAPIKVRYVLVYRGDRLVSEIWQIDPKLAVDY